MNLLIIIAVIITILLLENEQHCRRIKKALDKVYLFRSNGQCKAPKSIMRYEYFIDAEEGTPEAEYNKLINCGWANIKPKNHD